MSELPAPRQGKRLPSPGAAGATQLDTAGALHLGAATTTQPGAAAATTQGSEAARTSEKRHRHPRSWQDQTLAILHSKHGITFGSPSGRPEYPNG